MFKKVAKNIENFEINLAGRCVIFREKLYNKLVMIDELLRKFPLISDQVSREEMAIILRELERILTRNIEGDVVEFGCYKGTTSLFLARMMARFQPEDSRKDASENSQSKNSLSGKFGGSNFTFRNDQLGNSRKLWLYDSFEGLPEKTREDDSRIGEDFCAGKLATTKAGLLKTFAKNNLWRRNFGPMVVKKWFCDLEEKDLPEKICFAFLDGDFYGSIRDSFFKCEGKLAKGATIVIDDFANERLPGVARAVDEWRARNEGKIAKFWVEKSLGIVYLR